MCLHAAITRRCSCSVKSEVVGKGKPVWTRCRRMNSSEFLCGSSRVCACSLKPLCLFTAAEKHWFGDTLQCLGGCFLCTRPVPLIKFLLDNVHADREGDREWREDWQSVLPCASLSLSNRWANYCCSAQRALDGSNTLMNSGWHVHTQTAQTCLHTAHIFLHTFDQCVIWDHY